MKTKLARWGNDLAVRLPKDVTEELRLSEGILVEIKVADGALLLRPTAPRYVLNDLLKGVTRERMRKAWSWGAEKDPEAAGVSLTEEGRPRLPRKAE